MTVIASLGMGATLGVAGVGVMVGLLLFAIAMQADEKATVRASLRRLDGYEVDNLRDQELLNPLKERALLPLIERLTNLGRTFTPAGYADKVRLKFVHAGEPSADSVDRFLATRVACAVAAALGGFYLLFFGPMDGILGLALVGFWVAVFLLAPTAMLDRKVATRKQELQAKLPDILDLLVISVEAGLGFEQALDRTIAAVPGPLSEEFSRMLGEVRAGASRADAMRALDARCDVDEVRSFVLAILQADTFGVSIGRVLRSQADEMRIRRRQLAQERAQKAPVKMLIPMVFCIFPALFVVVLAPAVMSMMDKLG